MFHTYVASVCPKCFICFSVAFKCFHVAGVSCFRGMLQLFYMDVAKVDRGCCTCCKCFRDMLEVFLRFAQNVSSVPYVCCKRSNMDVAYISHICCNNMFQMFSCFSLMLQ